MKTLHLVVLAATMFFGSVAPGLGVNGPVGEDCAKPIDLTKVTQDLSYCNLVNVTINEVENPDNPRGEPWMFNWTLTGANLSGATFNVKYNSMIDVEMAGANISRASVNGLAALAYSNMVGVTARGIVLNGYGTLQGSDATGANFDGAKLLGDYSMSGMDLTGASLRRMTVSGDYSLEGVNLTDADLSGSVITGTDVLVGAIYDNTTCPDRTNSDDNGGTCVGHGVPAPASS